MTKQVLRRLLLLFCIFVGCVIAFSIQMNRKENTRAATMTGPSLPVAYLQVEGITVNPMMGYTQELREVTERESLTPLSVDRGVTLLVDPMENSIQQISYRVTSLEDDSLLENGELTDLTDAGGMLAASFSLQTNEIRNEQEYMLRFTLDLASGGPVYYYTRLVQYGAGNIGQYLSFTNSFIENATDKVTASDLGIYMEPDLAEANRSLAHITITSSTDMMSWSGLKPQIVLRTPPTILEINDINAGIRQQYIIKATDEDLNEEYYTVDEYFRITEYAGQLIVRNYQRDVSQIFDAALPIIGESAVNLGIQKRDLAFAENSDSTRAAFVVNGELWSYDAMQDQLTEIFSFRHPASGETGQPDLDLRTGFARHDISIGEINDAGDVTFVVYGYMPSGVHEGETGVAVCSYTAEENEVEEILFLPLNQSVDVLERNLSRLSYAGGGNALFLFMGNELCRVDLSNGSFSVEGEDIADSSFLVSGSQKQVAWTDSADAELGTHLTILNLASGRKREITAPSGQRITACGFLGEDIAYGYTYEEDIFYRPDGSALGGMYTIRVEDEEGELRKEYLRDGYYVTETTVLNDSLQMTLATRAANSLEEVGTDQIRNNEADENRVQILPISNSRTEEQMWLTFSDILLQTEPTVLQAKLSHAEGGIETVLEWPQTEGDSYYIYGYGRLQDIETSRNAAVKKAYDLSGGVLNEAQQYLWQRGSWPITYQVDLDTLSSTLLAAGTSGNPESFAQAIGRDKELVDLSGVVSTAMFYPISRGYPVYAALPDGGSQLLVGYSEEDVYVWDPATGGTQAIKREKADEIYQKAGYVFYTYQARVETEEAAEEGEEEIQTE